MVDVATVEEGKAATIQLSSLQAKLPVEEVSGVDVLQLFSKYACARATYIANGYESHKLAAACWYVV